jgi:hypothetical protein
MAVSKRSDGERLILSRPRLTVNALIADICCYYRLSVWRESAGGDGHRRNSCRALLRSACQRGRGVNKDEPHPAPELVPSRQAPSCVVLSGRAPDVP